ncbi:glutathione S-transferase family protein [Novosphingobium sp.]|uniref:glutathione S-transferase family protein n=1 Tax=Novosphingobium sp. TaxID=1874826 RepID=UPI002611B9CE|nr:glutathione S-transferase family protein [Novosphingobium sp.]
MYQDLTLVSHHLCPYVQRAAIAAGKLGVPFTRETIDLAAKPDWFLAISPTGKVPLLQVTNDHGQRTVLFESAAIAEFFNDIAGGGLLASDAVARARQRAWVEFASGTLSEIAGLYSAPDVTAFETKARAITARLTQVEAQIAGPWFDGDAFSLVDAAFGPVFRYLDLFEQAIGLALAADLPRVASWREALSADPIVAGAVTADYPQRLHAFMVAKGTEISRRLAAT